MAINTTDMPLDNEEPLTSNAGFINKPVENAAAEEVQVASLSPTLPMQTDQKPPAEEPMPLDNEEVATAELFGQKTESTKPFVQVAQLDTSTFTPPTDSQIDNRLQRKKLRRKTKRLGETKQRKEIYSTIGTMLDPSVNPRQQAEAIAKSDENFIGITPYEFSNLEKILIQVPIQFTQMDAIGKAVLRKAIEADAPGVAIGVMTAWNFADTYKGQIYYRMKDGAAAAVNKIVEYGTGQSPWEARANPFFGRLSDKFFNSKIKPLYLEGEDGKFLLDKYNQKIQTDYSGYTKQQFKNYFGGREAFKSFADDVVGGVKINYDDLGYLEKVFFNTLEFALPAFIVPFGLGMKVVRQGAKFMDRVYMQPKMLRRQFGDRTDDFYKEMAKGSQKSDLNKYKDGVTTFSIAKGDKIDFEFKHLYNRRKEAQGFQFFDGLNRNIGAGFATATAYTYFQQIYKEDFNNYKFIPYLFGMAGYMTGARYLPKAGYRMPVVGALVSSNPFMVVPPKQYVGAASRVLYETAYLGLTLAGKTNRQGLLMNFLKAHTTNASVPEIFKAYRKDRAAIKSGKTDQANFLRFLIEKQQTNVKGIDQMHQNMKQMPAEAKAEYVRSAEQFATMLERSIGANQLENFHAEDLAMMHQIIASNHTESLRRQVLHAVEFSSGKNVKSQYGGGIAASVLDQYEAHVAHQTNFLVKLLEKKSAEFAANKSTKTANMISVLDKELNKLRVQQQDFKLLRGELVEDLKDASGIFVRTRLSNLSKMDKVNGGFRVDKFDGSYESIVRYGDVPDDVMNNMSKDAKRLFNQQSKISFDDSYKVMINAAKKMYPDKQDMSNVIPATSLINRYEDSLLENNEFVMALMKQNNQQVSKKGFIAFTRLRFLESTGLRNDPNKTIHYMSNLQENLKGYKLFDGNKNTIDNDWFENMENIAKEGDIDSVLQELAKITSRSEEGMDKLAEMMPGVLRIQDAHNMRMAAWQQVNKLGSNATGSQKNMAFENANAIDDLFATMSAKDNQEAFAILEQIGVDPKKIQAILDKRQLANENYEAQIGSVWKTYLGSRLNESPFKGEKLARPQTSDERWVNWLFDPRAIDNPKAEFFGGPASIVMFNKMFKEGTAERETALELFSHSISVMLRKQNSITELNKLDPDHIVDLMDAKILTRTQGNNLLSYKNTIEGIMSKRKPPKIVAIERKMNKAINRLEEVQKETIRNSLGEQILKKGIINGEDLVKTLFDTDIARLAGNTFEEAGKDLMDLKETVLELRRLQEMGGPKAVTEAVKEADGALDEAYKQLNTFNFGDPTKALLDILGDSADNIAILDDIEQMMFHFVFRDSVRTTGKRVPFLTKSPAEDIYSKERGAVVEDLLGKGILERPASEIGVSANLGLQPEIDIDKLVENFAKMMKPLQAILEKRIKLGHNEEASKIFLKHLRDIDDVLNLTVKMKGQIDARAVTDFPKAMTTRTKLGRLYNWARGFVSPFFLGIERFADTINRTQSEIISEVLLDPKAGSVLLDMIRNDKVVSPARFDILGRAMWKAARGAAGVEEYNSISDEMKVRMAIQTKRDMNQEPPYLLKKALRTYEQKAAEEKRIEDKRQRISDEQYQKMRNIRSGTAQP